MLRSDQKYGVLLEVQTRKLRTIGVKDLVQGLSVQPTPSTHTASGPKSRMMATLSREMCH